MSTDADRPYVIAAGGTGGHVFPGVALARAIREARPGAGILFVGGERGLERQLVPAAGFTLELVPASGFAGKSRGEKLGALLRLPAGFLASRRLLRRPRARAVAGVGGYVTVPVLTAARSLGIPTLIHESNAMPGLANRFLNRIATATAVGLAAANARFARPGVVTGTPVRPEFFAVPPLAPSAGTRRLLVFGGSQGARVLNRVLAEASARLAAGAVEVIHQTGELQFEETRARYGPIPPGFRLERFLPRLQEELAWADLVVCRAGSQTLAELAAAGRPSVLVPFGSATHGHQLANARSFAEGGAAVVLEEEGLTAARLTAAVGELLENRPRLVAMGERARAFARPDAARELARLLFEAEQRAPAGAERAR
jgi:UDP-N-acetylglucosamine--N-acetylmuramyl-(pentapeptide) pyrophosphoryl-undecaprenol N-acetylglucosamine transferase